MEEPKYRKIRGLEQGMIDMEKYLSEPDECSCGGRFTYEGLGRYRCDRCGKIFENEYAIVRNFLDIHGSTYSILEISEMTGVPRKFIDWFVKEGRFIPVEKQRSCIICHQPITAGLYCNRCALREQNEAYEERRKKNLTSGVKNHDMDAVMHHARGTNYNDTIRGGKAENKK